METKSANICKIATYIEESEDLKFLKQLLDDNSSKNIILIGMGEKGKVTRTDFPKLGSKLTFCSVEQSTAPGQIPLQEMVKALRS